MTDRSGIRINGLYKIFGNDPQRALELAKTGIKRDELRDNFGHVMALDNINLDISVGRIQVIMGLSGSGKSTLIRHINRLIEPTAGTISISGFDVPALNAAQLLTFRREQTAMVFQKFGLLPHRTVLENVIFGLRVRGIGHRDRTSAASKWIERVGLGGFEGHYPDQLSGGMQQRVGLARALATNCPILLMDEAFSALDPIIRVDMQNVLLDIQNEVKKTIVFITHDLDEALRLGDNIAILRNGGLVQQGSAEEIVLNPADNYVANFVREVNRGRVITVDTIMERGRFEQERGSTVRTGTKLEIVAHTLATSGHRYVRVADGKGTTIGRVSAETLLLNLVSNREPEAAVI